MNKVYGLLGARVEGSFSPLLHSMLSQKEYRLFSLAENEAVSFLKSGSFDGLNITIPYKQTVLPYLQALGENARKIGSVNTIVRRADGSLFGENTDYDGLALCLNRLGVCLVGKTVLILGSGGTSKTARTLVSDRGGRPIIISRTGENNYGNLRRFQDAFGLINTTPVGMTPDNDGSPIDLKPFSQLRFVMDVIYTPLRTRLQEEARSLGIPCIGGLPMLIEQAVHSRALFDGVFPEQEAIQAAKAEILKRKSNLVLIGMPGCGKTVLAEMLGASLQLPVIDTDSEIEKRTGLSIPELFEQKGESYFRKLEEEQICIAGAQTGSVISTGGGAVLRERNRFHLRMNGFVVHITRNAAKLPKEGRPLSQLEKLEELEQERLTFYQCCRDCVIPNEGSLEDCCRAIEEAYHAYLHSEWP